MLGSRVALLVAVLVVGVIVGAMVAYLARPSTVKTITVTASGAAATTVTRTSLVTTTVTSTVTRSTVVTTTVTAVKTVPVGLKPRLVYEELVAEASSLPAYTYVNVWSWSVHAPYTYIAFSPDSSRFVVSITRYVDGKPVTYVRVYSLGEGGARLAWEYRVGSGYIRSLTWSTDSNILFVGECSVDGRILALDASTGKLVWEYATSKDLGRGKPTEKRWYWPSVNSLVAQGDRVWAVACKHRLKPYGKICKVYSFEAKTGRLVWVYPEKGFIDSAVYQLALSPDARYLAFPTWYYRGSNWTGGMLGLLDASTGKLVAKFYPGKREPFRFAGSWNGVVWLDEKHLAFELDDGRLYVLVAPELKVVQQVNVTSPLPAVVLEKKTGVSLQGYVYAYAGYAAKVVTPGGRVLLVIRTSNTYGISAVGKSAKPTINHPDANSIFIYLWENGKLRFLAKYPLRGAPNYEQWITYSKARGLALIPVRHDWVSRTAVYTGAYIYNFTDLEKLRSGLAEVLAIKPGLEKGVVLGGAISPDGRYVVVVTYPVNLGEPKKPEFKGDYRILVYSLGG